MSEIMDAGLREALIGREAEASVALDGETQAVDAPAGAHEGFGCPGCGSPLRLDKFALRCLARSHRTLCCGYAPTDDELGRWIRAGQLIRER